MELYQLLEKTPEDRRSKMKVETKDMSKHWNGFYIPLMKWQTKGSTTWKVSAMSFCLKPLAKER
jgi:hypothetical protein